MAKIVFLSDTHGFYEQVKIPPGDILVHAGDFGRRGKLSELKEFHRWFTCHPHPYKIFVAGNHDWCFEREPEASRAVMKDVIYLQDEAAKVMGLKVYGSPWQPRFLDWAFNLDRGEPLRKVWAKIPDDTDVLVTHTPPHGILDWCERDGNVGCKDLLARVREVRPKLHLFGHIHEGYGSVVQGPCRFANGCVCDEDYRPINHSQLFDIRLAELPTESRGNWVRS